MRGAGLSPDSLRFGKKGIDMYTYAMALALFVFPCLVEPGVVGVQTVGEYDATMGAPASLRNLDPPQQGGPAAEDRPLSSSAAFG